MYWTINIDPPIIKWGDVSRYIKRNRENLTSLKSCAIELDARFIQEAVIYFVFRAICQPFNTFGRVATSGTWQGRSNYIVRSHYDHTV